MLVKPDNLLPKITGLKWSKSAIWVDWIQSESARKFAEEFEFKKFQSR